MQVLHLTIILLLESVFLEWNGLPALLLLILHILFYPCSICISLSTAVQCTCMCTIANCMELVIIASLWQNYFPINTESTSSSDHMSPQSKTTAYQHSYSHLTIVASKGGGERSSCTPNDSSKQGGGEKGAHGPPGHHDTFYSYFSYLVGMSLSSS
jgi:hypothetical protein